MKKMRKLVSILLTAVILVSNMQLTAWATELQTTNSENNIEATVQTGSRVKDWGKCGESLSWILSDDGRLIIGGHGAMYPYYDSVSIPWYDYCGDVKKLIVESGVTEIGSFRNFVNMTSVTLPETLTTLGFDAFYNCSSLTEVTIPESVTSIGSGAFWSCVNLKSINLPKDISRIEEKTFCACDSLESIVIPDGVTTIGNTAFANCISLQNITIPSSVTSIERYAFAFCSILPEGDVYYMGTEEQWDEIWIDNYFERNNPLLYSNIHFMGSEVDGFSLEPLSIKYPDTLENKEKAARVHWGYPLFSGDAQNIFNTNKAYFSELVKISALLSTNSYDLSDGGYLEQTLKQLGAKDIWIAAGNKWGVSRPGHSISHIEFAKDDTQHDLIIVTVRGSDTTADWITDLDAWAEKEDGSSSKEHPGFSVAKDRIRAEVIALASEKGLITSVSGNWVNTSGVKILITGHSYGGAVANLLANSLKNVFDQSDIYAYTFGSPNNIVIDSKLVPLYKSVSNIHNFRNIWDPVARVPFTLPFSDETYTVWGQQYVFVLENIGEDSAGLAVWKNHNRTHYVNYALNLAKHNPIDSWKTRYVQINCPVDVTVYDENGEILGKITDNQLDEAYAGIMMYPIDDQKSIFIDEGEDVQFSIVATDAGTMDISIVEYDLVTGVVSATKEYSTIELKEDKSFSTSISDEIMVEDVELEVVDKEGYRVAIVNEDGTETKDISEQHKHTAVILDKEEATCIEAGLTEGEVCSVCDEVLREQEPIPALGHEYSNGKCIRCGGTPCGDLNADGSVNSADVNVIHRYVLDYVELTDEQMILADVNNDGKVNSADVNLLYRYVMGYVQSLTA